MGLGKSDLNGEVTVLQGIKCTVEYNMGLSKGDRNGEVTLLVRQGRPVMTFRILTEDGWTK